MAARHLFSALAVALTGLCGAALAQTAVPPDMVEAAKAGQAGCVKRGEDARVCACGVGLAYAQLEPKVFKLLPEVDPLLDKNPAAATGQLLLRASSVGLSANDLLSAYEVIKANRATVKQICKPLAPGAK